MEPKNKLISFDSEFRTHYIWCLWRMQDTRASVFANTQACLELTEESRFSSLDLKARHAWILLEFPSQDAPLAVIFISSPSLLGLDSKSGWNDKKRICV